MGRGVSSGGGQSSLGYLFGSGETPNKAKVAQNQGPIANNEPPQRPPAPSQPVDNSKLIPAGINSNVSNNYFRADGQNCGNFITDRPSTKVHAAPGGGSSWTTSLAAVAAAVANNVFGSGDCLGCLLL
ncbi:hypothetical protein AAG906_013347 [Vitis piasezkii]